MTSLKFPNSKKNDTNRIYFWQKNKVWIITRYVSRTKYSCIYKTARYLENYTIQFEINFNNIIKITAMTM